VEGLFPVGLAMMRGATMTRGGTWSRRSCHARLIATALFCAVAARPGLAQDAERIFGLIVEIAPKSGSITIDRRQGPHPAKLWDEIYLGDTVKIDAPDGFVRVETGRGPPLRIVGQCAAEPNVQCSPYKAAATASMFGELFNSVLFILRKPVVANSVNLVGRDRRPPQLAPNAGGGNLLLGKRRLYLPVVEGQPPYQATLTQQGKRYGPYAGQRGILTPEISLAEGEAQLSITDRKGQTSVATLRMVAQAPGHPSVDAAGSPVKPPLLAAWLATREDKRWSLEAVQQLRQDAGRDPLALAILERIVEVDRHSIRP
jgi:hypothetical protein